MLVLAALLVGCLLILVLAGIGVGVVVRVSHSRERDGVTSGSLGVRIDTSEAPIKNRR